MSIESEILLKNTVFRLLEYNRKDKEIFDELVSLNPANDEKKENTHLRVAGINSCVPFIPDTSRNTREPFSVEECVKRLTVLCESKNDQKLTKEQKDEVGTLINILKAHKLKGGLKFSSLTERLSVKCEGHLEILVLLHKHGIVPLYKYIEINQRRNDFVALFTKQISGFGDAIGTKNVIADILSELISLGYSQPDVRDRTKECSNTCCAILDSLVKDCLCRFLQNEDTNSIVECLSGITVPLPVLKSFYTHLFAVVVGFKPEMKVSKAVREQSQWTYPKINSGLVTLYKQILIVLGVTEILTAIRQILDQHEVNWRLFLSFIAVLTVFIQDAQKYILDFTDNLLQEGLEECDLETTITGLLVVRQACLQGPHVFMSYADWFQRTFSDSSRSLASSRKSFTFLMKLFTDLAPYESPQHIKVHILRPPHVPGKCRQILTDYIMLAKTRLQDLKEPMDVSSSDNADSNKKWDSFTEEVTNAVEAFKTLGKIPTSIIEASIFRKPYYIGLFLPVLLKPRPLPDMPDAKMKLITALKKADKIPQSMYDNYQKQCRKEAMQLMEGVFEDLDSDDDMALPALDQLENSLQHLNSVVNVHESSTDKPKHSMSEVVSVIASKVEACLSETPVNQIDSIPIDFSEDMTISGECLKVVDLMLNRISDVIQSVCESWTFNFSWLTKLLEALMSHYKFGEILYKRIHLLLVKQCCELKSYHIDSLAAVLVEIHMLKVQTPTVTMQCDAIVSSSILEIISNQLPMKTGTWMACTLRFLVSCLKYVYSSHLDEHMLDDVPCLIKKFTYLTQRLLPDCRIYNTGIESIENCDDVKDVVMVLKQAEFVKKLSEKYVLSLQEWLDYELGIDVEADLLASLERYKYHQYIVYHHYMQSTGGYQTYEEAASIMLKHLLTVHSHNQRGVYCYEDKSAGKGAEIEIIHLLSNLTQLFTESEAHNTAPWLPQQLTDVLNNCESDVTVQSIVLNFTRLALCLPAYLIFSDVPRCLTSKSSQLKGTLDFINTLCVTHISEGVLLPVSFTVYLAQGLLQASHPDHYTSIIEMVTDNCPAIALAFVVHRTAVEPFLNSLIRGTSGFAKFYNKLRSKNPNSAEDSWLFSCQMFSKILSSIESSEFEAPFSQNKAIAALVKSQVTELLLHQFTYLTQFATIKNEIQISSIHSALKVTLQQHRDVLQDVLCMKWDPRTKECVNSQLLKLYPVTVLRFLRDTSLDIGPLLTVESFNGLLNSYIVMCQLYEEETENTKVKTNEITQTCTYMVSIIEKTPREILKSINQDFLMDCGPVICDAVLKQI